LERTVTQGILSTKTRELEGELYLQTTTQINPGNSGGPLFNARGEVVGIVCAGATSFDGLAFGIPSNDLVDFLVHRESYLYDTAQPLNGATYLAPPYRVGGDAKAAKAPGESTESDSAARPAEASKKQNPATEPTPPPKGT
jgi:serine protease Do